MASLLLPHMVGELKLFPQVIPNLKRHPSYLAVEAHESVDQPVGELAESYGFIHRITLSLLSHLRPRRVWERDH